MAKPRVSAAGGFAALAYTVRLSDGGEVAPEPFPFETMTNHNAVRG